MRGGQLIAEVECAVRSGLRGGVGLPSLSRSDIPLFNDPRYEPFWAVCAANGMALNMHGGANHPHQDDAWPHTKASLRWTFGGDISDELRQMLGLNAICCYGLDRQALQKVADRVGRTEAEVRSPVDHLPEWTSSQNRRDSWAFRRGGPWH